MLKSVEATNELQQLLIKWKKEFVESSDNIRKMDYNGPISASDLSTDSERIRTLSSLCRSGADLQYLEKERGFALISKVFWCEELIQFFLNKGMDVNAKDENGDTALHLLIRHGHIDNIDIYIYTQSIHQCIYLKRRYPNFNPANLVQFLLEKSADPRVTNFFQENSLLALAKAEEYRYRHQETRRVADMLMKKGADVNTLNSDCESVLHISRKYEFFMNEQFSGNVDARSSRWRYSKTPLMIAASSNNLERCKFLVKMGANIHVKDLQGYTALHHAVLHGAQNCGNFLEMKGADPKEKSAFGNDCYKLGVYKDVNWLPDGVYLFQSSPKKQAEMLEIGGALHMMTDLEWDEGIRLWKKVKNICQKFNLQLSEEFLANFDFLVQNQNNPTAFAEMYLLALNTVTRLTDGNSKFWYLLSFAPYVYSAEDMYVFENLDILWQDELQFRVQDFVSLEKNYFSSLYDLVDIFADWLRRMLINGSKDQATPIRISQLHAVFHLVIACYRKLINETKSKKVSTTLLKLYIKLCFTLTLLHSKYKDVISKTAFNDNERLLRTMVELDLRDRYGNSLMHLILERKKRVSEVFLYNDAIYIELVSVLLDFDFVNIKAKNSMGFEPVQYINWEEWLEEKDQNPESWTDVMTKLATRGVHIDATNQGLARVDDFGVSTLREAFVQGSEDQKYLAFRCDNLKCACSRVLVTSLVPYRSLLNTFPDMVELIDSHRLQI